MAVSTLSSSEEGGYPELPFDWAVLMLVDENKNPTIPTWLQKSLSRHPKCNYCGKK